MMQALLVLASISTGTAETIAAAPFRKWCRGRADCSRHGQCASDGMSCACDPNFEGPHCDIWRPPAVADLRGVRWLNCTHGRPAGRHTEVVQLCEMGKTGVCEAAGAPTVPPPNWDGICYRPPTAPNTNADNLVCNFGQPGAGLDSVPTVIHGLKGAFCGPPCLPSGAASCADCPATCQIKNKTTGECLWCDGHTHSGPPGTCKMPTCGGKNDHGSSCAPCNGSVAQPVCPCPKPPGILAKPQCVLNGCGPYPWHATGQGESPGGRSICALTCDPDATVPQGMSNCQPGAVCERVQGAAFSPAGICTFPLSVYPGTNKTAPKYIPGDNKSAAHLPQPSPWTWADYKGNPTPQCGPQPPRYACVKNGSSSSNESFCVNVNNASSPWPYFIPGPFPYYPANCFGACKPLPPDKHIPMPGDQNCGNHTPPTPPPPPPSPPPPLATNPCIRFGHTIPTDHHVDVTIVQEENPVITHSWTNYKFGDFSDWVNVFKPGKGTITIFENIGGQRGKQLYQLKGIPLTPGPLVVVIKVASSLVAQPSKYWPPAVPDVVETIAASYVQASTSSRVRLFNLSPDTKVAGMTCSSNGTKELASDIRYSLGSEWYDVPTAAATFAANDDLSGKQLTSRQVTPPAAPIGFTNMLIGLQGGTGTTVVQLIPLQDAPEGGLCKP